MIVFQSPHSMCKNDSCPSVPCLCVQVPHPESVPCPKSCPCPDVSCMPGARLPHCLSVHSQAKGCLSLGFVPWRAEERERLSSCPDSLRFSQSQVFWPLSQIVSSPPSRCTAPKLVYIHGPCSVHGRCPFKRGFQISLSLVLLGLILCFHELWPPPWQLREKC